MSMKEILSEYGITTYQAIAALPILISLISVLFKFIKKPFVLIDIISRNKFILLPTNEKSDAIETVYKDIDPTRKSEIYARQIKLADYGLTYSVHTLRTTFDYLHSIDKLITPLYINDFLKHRDIFKNNAASLPVIYLKGFLSSLGVMLFLLILSLFAFATGFEGLMEALHSKPDWNSGARLLLFAIFEILSFTMVIVFAAEILSVFNASKFACKLRFFHDEQLYKKYKR